MKYLKGMERFFEKHIEGFFRQYFAAGVQPVEIGKQLLRTMEDNLQVSVTNTYAPNNYCIYLQPDDLERMRSLEISLTEELAQYILKQAGLRDLYIAGRPTIELKADAGLKVGKIRIEVQFVNLPNDEEGHNQQAYGTIVFEGIKEIVVRPAQHKAAPCTRLRVIEGVDKGKSWELGSARIYIGRRETNEIPLSDMNASRVHAYIKFAEGYYVLHDAKSLNGTYVNGERITHRILQIGDSITIGHTVLMYEVI